VLGNLPFRAHHRIPPSSRNQPSPLLCPLPAGARVHPSMPFQPAVVQQLPCCRPAAVDLVAPFVATAHRRPRGALKFVSHNGQHTRERRKPMRACDAAAHPQRHPACCSRDLRICSLAAMVCMELVAAWLPACTDLAARTELIASTRLHSRDSNSCCSWS